MSAKSKRPHKSYNPPQKMLKTPAPFLVKAEPASEKALLERIPELQPLRGMTIAVAGLGCVGAPSVMEFARCGIGNLRLLDHDQVSPGACCRWPLGLAYSGLPKSLALRSFIASNYPLTTTLMDHIPPGKAGYQIGRVHRDFDELEWIERFIQGADLVYDATAEVGVTQFLADICRKKGIPLVFVSSRQGGWGGEVGRIMPGRTQGCYTCLLHAQHERPELNPPSKNDDFVQPVGCGDPTFTAASFDTTEVSLAGVRFAISTLCEGHAGAYPAIHGDLAILKLREADGSMSCFPTWEIHPIEKHRACCGDP